MRNTQRNGTNIPTNLEALVHLTDVDLSENALTKIPEGLLKVPNLKRLNLGSNQVWPLTQLFLSAFCIDIIDLQVW